MKKYIFVLLAIFCITVDVATAENKYSDVALINVGKVDNKLFDRVKSYVEEQYKVNVVVYSPVIKAPKDKPALKKLLTANIKSTDICLVALANLNDIEKQGVMYSDVRCGAINVAALQPGKDIKGDKTEILGRRCEKETLRAIAFLIGIPPCPSLRCALYQNKNNKELDMKSRNPCPPCLEKIEKKLAADGLKLKVDKETAMPAGAAK